VKRNGSRFSRIADLLVDRVASRLEPTLLAKLEERLVARLQDDAKPWKKNLFVPSPDVHRGDPSRPFMQWSTCSSSDFLHPQFMRIFGAMHFEPFFFHRKYWEWVYIAHHLRECAREGRRGLGFGVGATEPLAALFASRGARIRATDAPEAIGVAAGWRQGGALALAVDELRHEGIIDKERLRERVEFRECDMNAIPAELRDFDFCWSSCCLEHLGDLRKGLDFIINSVERTLAIGGIACHTTEFNLSSNSATVERGSTVLYRRCDIEALIDELRARGHEVDDFRIAPDSLVVDGYVDTPPFGPPAHLKLDLGGFTATSMGLVVRRGR
jgi:hypothetical protein